jgi:hypothetical protein
MFTNVKEKLGVVAHDAGAANIILAGITESRVEFRGHFAGPALNIFEAAGHPCQPLDDVFDVASVVIFGTGWSKYEVSCLAKAKQLGIYCISIIDHWVNYKERFINDDLVCTPDEIWVVDEIAYGLATKIFPDVLVILKENRYLANAVESIRRLRKSTVNRSGNILYTCEPFRKPWNDRSKSPEVQALEYAIGNISRITRGRDWRIRVRPHPSEDISKYWFLQDMLAAEKLEYSTNSDLSQDIAWAEVVVGVESNALVIAAAAGLPTYSSMPSSSNRDCTLPHRDVIRIREMF